MWGADETTPGRGSCEHAGYRLSGWLVWLGLVVQEPFEQQIGRESELLHCHGTDSSQHSLGSFEGLNKKEAALRGTAADESAEGPRHRLR